MVKINDKAKEFCLPDCEKKEVCLKDFLGKWIVLYFYPKDNTSGWTKEAKDFSERLDAFKKANAVVIGISPDSPERHKTFIEKHNLKIILLSDVEKKVLKDYNAWQLKKNYGKESMGVVRSTYIINPEGFIVALWQNVKVRQKRKDYEIFHADKVLEKLKEIQMDN